MLVPSDFDPHVEVVPGSVAARLAVRVRAGVARRARDLVDELEVLGDRVGRRCWSASAVELRVVVVVAVDDQAGLLVLHEALVVDLRGDRPRARRSGAQDEVLGVVGRLVDVAGLRRDRSARRRRRCSVWSRRTTLQPAPRSVPLKSSRNAGRARRRGRGDRDRDVLVGHAAVGVGDGQRGDVGARLPRRCSVGLGCVEVSVVGAGHAEVPRVGERAGPSGSVAVASNATFSGAVPVVGVAVDGDVGRGGGRGALADELEPVDVEQRSACCPGCGTRGTARACRSAGW